MTDMYVAGDLEMAFVAIREDGGICRSTQILACRGFSFEARMQILAASSEVRHRAQISVSQ
jgi:hypothetical protein